MIKIALKDLRLFLADKKAIALTFILPISLITLFAFAFGGVGREKKGPSPMSIVISDEDRSAGSESAAALIDSQAEFSVVRTTTDTAERWVRKGDEAVALIFRKGFGDSMEAGKPLPLDLRYDAARHIEVSIIQGALTGLLMRQAGQKGMVASSIRRFDASFPYMDSGMRASIHAQIAQNFGGKGDNGGDRQNAVIRPAPLVAEAENSPGLIQAVSGTAIMMLLFSVTGIGASLLEEKEEGTLKKLLVAPVRPSNILFGKMLFTNAVSVAQLTVMFIYARIAFGLEIVPHLPALAAMIIATAFACSSFGVLLASFAKTRAQVQGISTLIILVMSCIGGSMVPTFIMPQFMQKIAAFSVNYWGIQGFYDIFWRMLPPTDLVFLGRIGMLCLIGTAMSVTATFMFRRNVLEIAS